MDLAKYLVEGVPPSVYYIPNFITEAEEEQIIKKVNLAPKPKWTQLSHRRLQNWGGIPHSKGMIAEKIPPWLQEYMNRIGCTGVFQPGCLPNHVLVNEYLPGQGIMPHTDGPLFHPVITTITCGSHTVLEFQKNMKETVENKSDENQTLPDKTSEKQTFSLLLERCSLVIIQDDVYKKYLHSIEEISCDSVSSKISNLQLCENNYSVDDKLLRGVRISLTIRHVPCTTKVLLRLCK